MANWFVGFFGINRALKTTIQNIESNIYQRIRSSGSSYLSCAHFNNPSFVDNPRSQEKGSLDTWEGLDRLRPELLWVEEQDNVQMPEASVAVIETHKEMSGDPTGKSARNLLFQYHSLKQVAKLGKMSARQFDIYCFLRADLLYNEPLDAGRIEQQILNEGYDLVTPSWHKWGGFNDRFAFCSARGAEVYTNRLESLPRAVSTLGSLHPESVLKRVAEDANLKCGFLDLKAARVRLGGFVVREI
jgi:hypothetical protein